MKLKIIGGGLVGCEATWQAAERGVEVELFEMRQGQMTDAHRTGNLAELVYSNSLGSNLSTKASGLLKDELRRLNACLVDCADASSLPTGSALAVDRDEFFKCAQDKIENHPLIRLIQEEVRSIPASPAVLVTGPLTSPALSKRLQDFTGQENLFFYDAIAPIVNVESINMAVAYRADPYIHGNTEEGDYINCPLDKEVYQHFREALDKRKVNLSQKH